MERIVLDDKTQDLLHRAIEKQYSSIFIIDVEKDSIQGVIAPDDVINFAAQYKTASETLMAFTIGFVSATYLEEAIHFSTWDNIIFALNTRGIVSFECNSKFGTWCRISYISMERDQYGNLKKFVLTIQILDEEKKEELVRLDELGKAKIESEIENNKLLNMNRDISLVNSVLSRDYANIYLVDPSVDTVKVIKQDYYRTEDVSEGEYLTVPYNIAFRKYIDDCVHPDDKKDLYQAGCRENVINLLKATDIFTYNYRSVHKGLHNFQFTFRKIEDGRIVLGFRNTDSIIEGKNRQREQLEAAISLAEHDSMTGAFNRNMLNRMESAASKSEKLCLMMIDVDNFKQINDKYGHEAGDRIITRLASLLMTQSRETDTVVRYGGDEFLIIMKDTAGISESVIAGKFNAIKEAISKPAEDTISVSVSAGIAFSNVGYCKELFNKADAALYNAKAAGKKTFSIDFDTVMERGNVENSVPERCAKCLYDRQKNKVNDPEYIRRVKEIIDTRAPGDTSPYLVYRFENLHREMFGSTRDYSEIKKKYNDLVLSMEEGIRNKIKASDNPLRQALKYARVGNYIDFGAMDEVSEEQFIKLLDDASFSEEDERTFDSFVSQLKLADNFLLITDNCGEIVLDKLFLEQLKVRFPRLNLQVLVRGGEVLNDATCEDAEYVGIDRFATVTGNGMPIAGTVYDMLTKEAKECIDEAQVILAKGQGNYESMNGQGIHVFYSFLCKCDMFMDKFQVPQFTGMFIEE